MDDLNAVLLRHRTAWQKRPLLRRLYRDWYREIAARLTPIEGLTIELGSGIGQFKEVVPSAVMTDVEPTPWSEQVVDAEALPYDEGSVANLVLVDVFHHLARPRRFLEAATRVLAPGGRVVLLEPYCSFVSSVAYRLFHHERTDLAVDGLAEDARIAAAPLESNMARATLAFFRQVDRFEHEWPQLRVLDRRRLSVVAYPLSGGFGKRPLVPGRLSGPVLKLERALEPLAPLAGFRCLVTLERAPDEHGGIASGEAPASRLASHGGFSFSRLLKR